MVIICGRGFFPPCFVVYVLFLTFKGKMGDFSDDIFSVFDETAPDPAPIVKIEEKLIVKEPVQQSEEK